MTDDQKNNPQPEGQPVPVEESPASVPAVEEPIPEESQQAAPGGEAVPVEENPASVPAVEEPIPGESQQAAPGGEAAPVEESPAGAPAAEEPIPEESQQAAPAGEAAPVEESPAGVPAVEEPIPEESQQAAPAGEAVPVEESPGSAPAAEESIPEESQQAAPQPGVPAGGQPYPPQPWQGWYYGAPPQAPYAPPPAPGGYYPYPQGWYQPQPGQPWYGQPAGQPAKPPRKKMSRGLKVFLWIASALTVGVVLGFAGFVVSWAVAGPQQGGSLVETLPEESQPDGSQEGQDAAGTPEIELPDVDVTPNEEGITIHEKPEGEALDAQEVYNQVVKSTVAITVSRTGETTDSSGTGIIATSDGYIITNAHVVLNTKSVLVTVTTYDGQQYDAVVVGMDRTTDLAIIKTNDYGFTPAQFGDSDQLSIREWVVAIGNPGGERFASSLTRGIISGLDRAVERYSEDGMTFIQTDAAINPGNSGGPLVNMYGQVVGINSSKIITDGYEGMGFAIPVSKAKDIIDQLLSGGYVEGRVRLGITGSDISATQAAFYGVPRGFMIVSIDEDSAFAGTEAQPEDIITAIDGETVEELQDISNLLLRYSPGDQVTVTLYRPPVNGMGEGEELEVTITLLEDKGETQR